MGDLVAQRGEKSVSLLVVAGCKHGNRFGKLNLLFAAGSDARSRDIEIRERSPVFIRVENELIELGAAELSEGPGAGCGPESGILPIGATALRSLRSEAMAVPVSRQPVGKASKAATPQISKCARRTRIEPLNPVLLDGRMCRSPPSRVVASPT